MAKSNLSELLGESAGPYDGEASDDEGYEAMPDDMGGEDDLPDSYSLYLDEFSEAMGMDRAKAERVADALMGMMESRDLGGMESDMSADPTSASSEEDSLALLLGE